MTGHVLSLVTRFGDETAADFVRAHFRRQHVEKFLAGLERLGLHVEPDAVACALYHYHSNALGGVKTQYLRESDTKAWVRYPPPRWIWRGTAACGIPHAVNVAILDGWHGHNGVSLGNPRLGFVCTATLTAGQPGLEGYYFEYDREIRAEERVRFVDDERMPLVDPTSQPALDTETWPEERRRKTLRNYAVEYVRTLLPTTMDILGVDETAVEVGRTARLVGMQFFDQVQQLVPLATESPPAIAFGRWLAVMLASAGDTVHLETDGASALVTTDGWRLARGLDFDEVQHLAALTAWHELWVGAALAYDRSLDVTLTPKGERTTWEIRQPPHVC